MAVLFYQSDAPVVEQRQRAGAAGMANDFADDLDSVLFTQPVAFDVEYGAFEDYLRFQQLSWQIIVLSRPRYSIMRLFARARRPGYHLEFQAKRKSPPPNCKPWRTPQKTMARLWRADSGRHAGSDAYPGAFLPRLEHLT